MANVLPGEGAANSNIVNGNSRTLTYTIGSTQLIDVESVVAAVTNASGSAVSPKMTIRDPSGQVIATKTQGDTIPNGDDGTATFALRLTDDGGGIRFNRTNRGTWLDLRAAGSPPPGFSSVYIDAEENIDFIAGDEFNIDGTGGSDFNLNMGQDVNLVADRDVNASADGDVNLAGQLTASLYGKNFAEVKSQTQVITGATQTSGVPYISHETNRIQVALQAGQVLNVLDRNGNTIFRVNEDGALQGKTGKALTFNL